jgi:2-keto-4-pentenoate hydratase/2-oxohepta-3-ene-1,7-dioic acid hydratase in catechol pathway
MRLTTVQTADGAHAAAFQEGRYVLLAASDPSIPDSIRLILEGGDAGLRAAAEAARRSDAVSVDPSSIRLLPPVPDPKKIVCLGLNYRDHAAESGAAIPKEPIVFSKYATALVGPEAAIVLPPVSREVDYEAELVVVVGRRGRHLTPQEAVGCVAGYTIGHDVSARDWQLKKDQKQWMIGKTFDSFAPTGPWLVTADEVPDPHALGIRLRLNGRTMQESNTRQMVFRVEEVLAYLSQVFTLEPGDLVFTGTPPGVGFVRQPPVFLRPGDVVDVEIDGMGVLRNPVIQG